MTLSKNFFSLLIFVVLAFGASAWGGFITSMHKEPWYSTIAKATFNPPDWVFAPVWITLYLFDVRCNMVNLDQSKKIRKSYIYLFYSFIC